MNKTEEKKPNKEKLYNRLNKPAFYVAVLGAVKLITQAAGYDIITDDQINLIANGLASLATVAGVILGWEK